VDGGADCGVNLKILILATLLQVSCRGAWDGKGEYLRNGQRDWHSLSLPVLITFGPKITTEVTSGDSTFRLATGALKAFCIPCAVVTIDWTCFAWALEVSFECPGNATEFAGPESVALATISQSGDRGFVCRFGMNSWLQHLQTGITMGYVKPLQTAFTPSLLSLSQGTGRATARGDFNPTTKGISPQCFASSDIPVRPAPELASMSSAFRGIAIDELASEVRVFCPTRKQCFSGRSAGRTGILHVRGSTREGSRRLGDSIGSFAVVHRNCECDMRFARPI
jgi:hypothetical protein